MMNPRIYRILKNLDVDAVRADFIRQVGPPVNEPGKGDPILASLHKARVMAGRTFSRSERELSRNWLQQNGYSQP